MSQTLGATFDASLQALRAATRTLPAIPAPGQIRTLAFQIHEFVGQLRAYPDTFARDTARIPGGATVMGRALADIRVSFTAAERHVADAWRQAAGISGPAGAPGRYLEIVTHEGDLRCKLRPSRRN